MDMGSLMIKPVQRVMKYPLLLCELLNSTPASHPDHKALQEALFAMKSINVNINELKRRKDLGKKKAQYILLSVGLGWQLQERFQLQSHCHNSFGSSYLTCIVHWASRK